MIFARLIVGLIAALICIAGIGWYAFYLFSPESRKPISGGDSTTSLPMKVHPALARRQSRRSLILGAGAVVGILALTPLALNSIRTGVPVQILNETPMNGWILLAMILFVGVLGVWLVASEFLKSRKFRNGQ